MAIAQEDQVFSQIPGLIYNKGLIYKIRFNPSRLGGLIEYKFSGDGASIYPYAGAEIALNEASFQTSVVHSLLKNDKIKFVGYINPTFTLDASDNVVPSPVTLGDNIPMDGTYTLDGKLLPNKYDRNGNLIPTEGWSKDYPHERVNIGWNKLEVSTKNDIFQRKISKQYYKQQEFYVMLSVYRDIKPVFAYIPPSTQKSDYWSTLEVNHYVMERPFPSVDDGLVVSLFVPQSSLDNAREPGLSLTLEEFDTRNWVNGEPRSRHKLSVDKITIDATEKIMGLHFNIPANPTEGTHIRIRVVNGNTKRVGVIMYEAIVKS